MTKFNLNDVVRFKGGSDEFKVVEFQGQSIRLDFYGEEFWFLDTRLELVRRPKRKETRTVERWVNVHKDKVLRGIFETDADAALGVAYHDEVRQVRLTGTYEVEVDE